MTFSELLQNNPMTYVPLSPLLNNAFNMLFQQGQQKRAEAQAKKAQKHADLMSGIGMGTSAATTLGMGAMLGGLGGGGGGGVQPPSDGAAGPEGVAGLSGDMEMPGMDMGMGG